MTGKRESIGMRGVMRGGFPDSLTSISGAGRAHSRGTRNGDEKKPFKSEGGGRSGRLIKTQRIISLVEKGRGGTKGFDLLAD